MGPEMKNRGSQERKRKRRAGGRERGREENSISSLIRALPSPLLLSSSFLSPSGDDQEREYGIPFWMDYGQALFFLRRTPHPHPGNVSPYHGFPVHFLFPLYLSLTSSERTLPSARLAHENLSTSLSALWRVCRRLKVVFNFARIVSSYPFPPLFPSPIVLLPIFCLR